MLTVLFALGLLFPCLCVIDERGHQVAGPQRNSAADGRPKRDVAPRLVDGPGGRNPQVWRGARHQTVRARVHVHVGGGGHH